MRISILVVSIGLLLLILVGMTADIAIAKFEPFHPGEALFIVQKIAEQNLLKIIVDHNLQATYVLGLVQHSIIPSPSTMVERTANVLPAILRAPIRGLASAAMLKPNWTRNTPALQTTLHAVWTAIRREMVGKKN